MMKMMGEEGWRLEYPLPLSVLKARPQTPGTVLGQQGHATYKPSCYQVAGNGSAC